MRNLTQTNEEIQNEIEAKLAEMTPEEREAMIAMDNAADQLAIIQLRQKYGVNIELIPNDRHHILVDGQRMGYVEFNAWLASKIEEEGELEEDDEELEDDEDEESGSGWFNA